MTWILTHSGKHFDFLDPQPDQVCIGDIAHALSRICRFTGHTSRFYSVAEHSFYCSKLVDDVELKLEALLHDAHEAYINDISSPLKKLLPDYQLIEKRVDAVIRDKFGLPARMSIEVQQVDLLMLGNEMAELMPPYNALDAAYKYIYKFKGFNLKTPYPDIQTRFNDVFFDLINRRVK